MHEAIRHLSSTAAELCCIIRQTYLCRQHKGNILLFRRKRTDNYCDHGFMPSCFLFKSFLLLGSKMLNVSCSENLSIALASVFSSYQNTCSKVFFLLTDSPTPKKAIVDRKYVNKCHKASYKRIDDI